MVVHSEKHPKSLSIFFATEMWERYGFYVVQSLLALYLALHFKWPDKQIYTLIGSFTALTYLSPVIGGWIADRLIGQKKSILTGAIILFISYCGLSLINDPAILTAALAGIAVGTGLLKPNISALLGNEYLQNSIRRESGFTIFYMGITLGIILGTTVPSLLQHALGWNVAFISAAIGMFFSFTIFLLGIKIHRIKDYNSFALELKNLLITFLLIILLWAGSYYILNSPQLANLAFGCVVLFSVAYITYAVHGEDANQSRQTLIIGLLCIISAVFWAFYFQMFMSLTLFIARVVNPNFFRIHFPAPYYVALQSLGMLIIGYFLTKKQTQLNLRNKGLSIGKKFITAIAITVLAYTWIAYVPNLSFGDQLISPLLIIPTYLLFSIAELLLSPVGLSAITLLADKNKVSTMMGIFFVSLGIGGGFLSGKLASLSAIPEGETHIKVLKSLYAAAFTQQLYILFVAATACVILFAVIKFLLIHVKD